MDLTPNDTTHHVYYYDPKAIDIAKLRAEATFRLTDPRNGPTKTIIHYHSASADCSLAATATIADAQHEIFAPVTSS